MSHLAEQKVQEVKEDLREGEGKGEERKKGQSQYSGRRCSSNNTISEWVLPERYKKEKEEIGKMMDERQISYQLMFTG